MNLKEMNNAQKTFIHKFRPIVTINYNLLQFLSSSSLVRKAQRYLQALDPCQEAGENILKITILMWKKITAY